MIDSIGHYSILGLIGAGGRGEVYRARDTKVGRTVAIRLLGPRTTDALERDRFLHAIDALTRISHPNIAALFEAGQQEGQVYLVSEFVPGETLSAMMAGYPLNSRRAVDLAAQVADALAEAHAADLVHQRLTPANIIVTPKGHAKILDLGLSLWHEGRHDSRTAARPASPGTAPGGAAAAYMSPEQVLGHGVDYRSDLFTLGAILFEMLTGRRAFPGRNDGDISVQVLQSTPPAPSSINADIPADLDIVVAKAMAKTIGDRFQSAAEMAAALRAVSASLQSMRGSTIMPASAIGAARRFPRFLAVGTLLIVALAASAWIFRDDILRAWASRVGPAPSPVVVVTPFLLQADDGSRPYFGAGLAEDVAMRLGQVRGVSVVGRLSLRNLAGRDAVSVASEMQAGLVVTGAVTPQGEDWTGLKVRVDLLDGRDGSRIWSSQYDSAPRDVLALQVRIATDLASAMRIPDEPRPAHDRAALRLTEPGAYDLYLQAGQAAATGDLTRAAELYTNALERDPGAVEAQAALAVALHASAVDEERAAFAEVEPRIRQAAEQAATSDPDLPAARLAMGLAAPTLRDSLGQLRAAAGMDPSSAAIFSAIGNQIREIDPALALQFYLRAQALDPAQARIHLQSAAASVVLGQPDPAQAEVARGQAIAPDSPWWDAMRIRLALGQSRRNVLAQLVVRKDTEFAAGWYGRTLALRLLGRTDEALASAMSLVQVYPAFCEARAVLAGLRMDTGDQVEARRLAGSIFQSADAPGGSPSWSRCAAMAAAALSDGDRTARLIQRVAADQVQLHRWTTVDGMLGARAAIRQRLFPWSNVIGHPAVVQALAALDRAMARARGDVATSLDRLLESSRGTAERR
jgi:TolB-like protein